MKRSLVLAALFAVACGPDPVGLICYIGDAPDNDTQLVIGSPAYDCRSHLCLHVPGQQPDLCTATCDTSEDCAASEQTPCETGFSCVAPVSTGKFACQPMCVCNDYALPAAPGCPE